MAKKETKSKEEDADVPAKNFDIVPSALDDKTHDEMQILYRESTETMRFIKSHQWKTVGATLLTFLGLIVVARVSGPTEALNSKLMAIVIILTTAVIFTLIIYQFWTHNELTKLDRMQPFMSNLFADIRALKSKKEGNFHRYTLLFFMVVVVVLGATVAHLALDRMLGY